jgi:dihydrofolate reductase
VFESVWTGDEVFVKSNGKARPKISVFVGASIDGFIARTDGSFDFLEPFEGEEHGYTEFMRSVDTLVIGRATYELVLSFEKWLYGKKRVIVLTHRPIDARHGETSHEGALAPLFERLGNEGAKRVYLDGGRAIRQGLDEDLVDDITISTVPVTIGAGIPLFGGAPCTTRWTLASSRVYPSGLVSSRYERDRG